ncbi:MAG TPA: IS30 family transposase [Gemmatimonadales bacterium]|nr:IS30 family transposase [Gemmatimonadales bacterium]
MGRSYTQFTLEERCTVARLQATGHSLRQIAAALGRAPSSVAREVTRNSGRQVGYQPGYAHQQAHARRWYGLRLERDASLREAVLDRLKAGWSPAQVAGRLAREAGHPVLSHETIYRFIDAQIRRTQDYDWRHYLPRAKSRRGWRRRKGGSPAEHMAGRVSIAERPAAIATRAAPGHWEADLMLFARPKQGVLVTHERQSRLLWVRHQSTKAAASVAQALGGFFRQLPAALRHTVTFDNGTEFAQHQQLRALAIDTYFCDPHAPWQKGGIENAIGRLRRQLPRKTDLRTVTPAALRAMVARYNHTPRACLGFQTPAEVFHAHLLHFNCDSTPRLSSG